MKIEEVDAIINATLENMEGWCPREKGRRMARLALEAATLQPYAAAGPLCVELGVFGGRGVVAMGLAVEHCLARNGRVHGIDPYSAPVALEGQNSKENDEWWAKVDYPKILAGALAWINRLGLHGVTIIASRSQDAVSSYEDGTIDLLHQDSNHSEEVSRTEVKLWAPKMRPGGFWVFDDTNWPTTKPAQQDLLDKGFALLEDHGTWAIFKAPSAPCGPASGI